MSKDRDEAERMGLTHREFSLALLRAQRKVGRGEELDDREAEVWKVATATPPDSVVIPFRI
jgi:hypothetical protein